MEKAIERITAELGSGMSERSSGAGQIDLAVHQVNNMRVENKQLMGAGVAVQGGVSRGYRKTASAAVLWLLSSASFPVHPASQKKYRTWLFFEKRILTNWMKVGIVLKVL